MCLLQPRVAQVWEGEVDALHIMQECRMHILTHLNQAVNIQSAQTSTEGDCHVDVLMM